MQKPKVISLLVMLTLLILTKVISASTFVSNTTPSNKPLWLSPGWRFTAQSDTSFWRIRVCGSTSTRKS